jgi:hypothetical protein
MDPGIKYGSPYKAGALGQQACRGKPHIPVAKLWNRRCRALAVFGGKAGDGGP